MVPVSADGWGGVVEGGGARGGSISLSVLIEFIVQRTYHDLTVLAELLPRKTDMERKVEIYKLSARTRQLFVRLLALVKWAGSASKVDRSANIMTFLDKQAMLFVDTADMLFRMARETLVHARLPTFHIPAAVEVLTQGTYMRLPVCIKDKLVPADGLTQSQKRATLKTLNHVITQRLVGCNLPPNMRSFKVENGRVTFHVGGEFSVSLTVMGDSSVLPWRLLDVAILVQDNEIGEGKPLVHQRQVAFIRSVAQARLAAASTTLAITSGANSNAAVVQTAINNAASQGLHALLAVLSYFCRSLQLELLYTQTLRLARDRLGKHIQVDQYVPGRKLTVSYWRELGCELGYRITVQAEASGSCRALTASHVPQLAPAQEAQASRALSHPSQLSMERLLVTTIHVRSRARLHDLKILLTDMGVECTVGGSPCVLCCWVLSPCLRAEQLLVCVGVHCGSLRCHIPQHPNAPLQQLPKVLALHDTSKIAPLLADLRFWLMFRRCEKTLQHLPATAWERLPIICPPTHPVHELSPHKLYVTLHRHSNYILVVEMHEDESNSVKLSFHLGSVRRCGPEEEDGNTGLGGAQQSSGADAGDVGAHSGIGGAFYKLGLLVQFDTFVLTHGPFTPVDPPNLCGKRKALTATPGRSVRSKQPAYFIPELAHVVAAADERIPFVYLAQEVASRGICHGGLQVEAGGGPALRLITLPCPPGAEPTAAKALQRRLLAAAIRLQPRGQTRVWTAELVFHSTPLRSSHPKEQGMRRCVYFQYEMCPEGAGKVVEALLTDWCTVVKLHQLVYHYTQREAQEREMAESHVSIVSYDYRRLVLGAGPEGRARCTVTWAGGRLHIKPAAGPLAVNAHALITHQLEAFLNRTNDLIQLMWALRETYAPLVALGRLPSTPHLGLQHSRPQVPVQTFTILPHSLKKIRVVYQGSYCLEVTIRGAGCVAVRDGAYSRFDWNGVIGEFTPIQGLKSFLSLYVSESGGRVVSEDDNPPSPVSPRDGTGGSSVGSAGTGGSLLRFPAPLTPPQPHTPHSQPHTPHPASPHQGGLGGGSGTFGITSPTIGSGVAPHASPASPQQSPLPQMTSTASPGPAYSIPPGSPFTAWPGSPCVPRGSPARNQEVKASMSGGRVLTGSSRVWAGAVATQLSTQALEMLCAPCDTPPCSQLPGAAVLPQHCSIPLAPLERFLGCVYMRKHLQRFIQQEDTLSLVPCAESGVVMFRAEARGLQGRVALNPTHMQSLQLTLAPLPEHKDQWSPDDLQVMEKYFEARVVSPPYKPNSIWGWGKAWGAPTPVLRDLVQLMRRELHGVAPGQAWALQWALRIPPQAVQIVPTAHPAVVLATKKILIFLSLTRGESLCVIPLVYDFVSNTTQLAEKRDPGTHHPPTSLLHHASIMLKRFADFGAVHGECSLWPAVKDLLSGLMVPQDAAPPPP